MNSLIAVCLLFTGIVFPVDTNHYEQTKTFSNDRPTNLRSDRALFIVLDSFKRDLDLKHPAKEASEIANVLDQGYGTEIDFIYNPTQEEIQGVLKSYQDTIFNPNSQLFVFFHGRGRLLDGQVYFMPTFGDPTDAHTLLSYKYLTETIAKIPCEHILVSIDAHHSNVLEEITKLNLIPSSNFEEHENAFKIENQLKNKSRVILTSGNRTNKKEAEKSNYANQIVRILHGQAAEDKNDGFIDISEFVEEMKMVKPTPRYGTFTGHEKSGKVLFIPLNSYIEDEESETYLQVGEDRNLGLLFDKRQSENSKPYKTITLGNKVWMEENIRFDTIGTYCYRNEVRNCQKYGTLYPRDLIWAACPNNWHIPIREEWKDYAIGVHGNINDTVEAGNDAPGRAFTEGSERMESFEPLGGHAYANGKDFDGIERNTYIWSASSYDKIKDPNTTSDDFPIVFRVDKGKLDKHGKNQNTLSLGVKERSESIYSYCRCVKDITPVEIIPLSKRNIAYFTPRFK